MDAQLGKIRLYRRGKQEDGPTRFAQTRPAVFQKGSAHGAEQQASIRKKEEEEAYADSI